MHTYELIKVFKEQFRQRPKPAKSYSLLKDFKSRFDSKNRPSILEKYVSFVLVCMYLFHFLWRLLALFFFYYISLLWLFSVIPLKLNPWPLLNVVSKYTVNPIFHFHYLPVWAEKDACVADEDCTCAAGMIPHCHHNRCYCHHSSHECNHPVDCVCEADHHATCDNHLCHCHPMLL